MNGDESNPEIPRPIVCTNCLARNGSYAHFCGKCGTPLDSIATTSPFERIFAEGNALFKATTQARSRKSLIWLWLAYGWMPILLPATVFLLVESEFDLNWFIYTAAMLGCSIWSIAILVKAHRNFRPQASSNCETCLACGAAMPLDKEKCPSCGWSYKEAAEGAVMKPKS